VPHVVRKYVAALVAKRAAIAVGVSTPLLDAEIRDSIRPDLALWRQGVAIRGQAEPTGAQVPQLYTFGSSESTRTL
jgi:hypothetical protein